MSSPAPVSLRPLRWWDIAGLVPLERALFPDDAWAAEAFWGELALGSVRPLPGRRGRRGGDLGYAGLSCLSPARGADAEVMTLAVAPWAQGRGVGGVLLDALLAAAVDRGAGRVMLEVRADNAAARALYAAAGFEQVAVREGYYRLGSTVPDGVPSGVPVDALVLRLPLSHPANDRVARPDSVRP